MRKPRGGTPPHRGRITLTPGNVAPAALLARIFASDAALKRKSTFLFALMPGARDVCLKFAAFVGDLPGPSPGGVNLLTASVRSAVAAVDPHGITPYTVSAHLDGFANFCGGILSHSAFLASLQPVDSIGRTWTPLLGPFPEWCRSASGAISLDTDAASAHANHLEATVRLFVLARLLTRHDLPRMVARWPDITLPSAC